MSGYSTAPSASCGCCKRAPHRSPQHHRAPRNQPPGPRSLGQPRRLIERGYAGDSLWQWQSLPDYLSPRYSDYARACASIGINGTVLNNVNATPFILTPLYLHKAAALAGVLRPYGMKVYLSVPFGAPVDFGRLKTADPLDPRVQAWWRAKADEIYREIPDFGGLLVKANSEGQPGPEDYGRTHAQGANLLARALAPHGGIVMWRAFVYTTGSHAEDRARQAYDDFKPLDGKFADNVLVQVKNGPIDFQPREPFHPLFGAMPHTHADARAADHQGIPRPADEPRLPRAALRGSAARRHLGRGPGSTVARVDRRLALRRAR